ncbi:MAG: pilus assembly protein PilZ [Alteromonadaceae bacterium]|jgi:type IV pilus assembly protein PilZ|uniref:PilZ domain-containing protein n=2 Tax=Rheinheimera TaxID=67575 RepID=A0ABN1DEB7_9GAMM|nr:MULTISPECIES: PilZ domain-containing protein [Rheinheimera]MBJ91083.1 pilus assembly protein PilZ [Alteromonadaceae bacterium]MCB5212204.1 PilZ domain-containing protein [Rheinheimera aquimaris]MCD1599353.1 PilZ domain-containing protein [Rheinheimera aquimaris]|tara:strand:+ start:3161 stop:3487 length:327 start_codon:yes stop_codon:yes gene_type:complete
MEELTIGFNDLKDLYRSYMPFLKNGGLFVRTARQYKMGQSLALSVTLPDSLESITVSGKVAWITPHGSQSSNPAGVGISFIDDKSQLSAQIEKLLGGMLNSPDPTHTI